MTRSVYLFAVVMSALVACQVVHAGEPVKGKKGTKIEFAEDPAFRSFFAAKDVGDALAALDSRRLTDCALLLAQGERILLREHAHLSSKKLFELALNVAAERGDQAAIKRLEKAIRGGGDADLIVKLDAAILLGKKARKTDPFAKESTSIEAQVLYKSMNDEINVAKNLNDSEALEGLRKTIPTLTELTAQQRKQLTTQVESTLRAVAKEQEPEDQFLAQLARASRASKVQPPKKK